MTLFQVIAAAVATALHANLLNGKPGIDDSLDLTADRRHFVLLCSLPFLKLHGFATSIHGRTRTDESDYYTKTHFLFDNFLQFTVLSLKLCTFI